MASARITLARKRRDALHKKHGNQCRLCGESRFEAKLHIDCIIPQGFEHHRKMGFCCRMRFYVKQDAQDNIRLLCEKCNCSKGSVEDRAYHARMRQKEEEEDMQASAATACIDYEVPF
jgi:5-methylcytosine-specific restriction endonuclease McrA